MARQKRCEPELLSRKLLNMLSECWCYWCTPATPLHDWCACLSFVLRLRRCSRLDCNLFACACAWKHSCPVTLPESNPVMHAIVILLCSKVCTLYGLAAWAHMYPNHCYVFSNLVTSLTHDQNKWHVTLWLGCRGTQFHGETTMWDIVKDKLLAAMIILARTFPLHEALQGHKMADWIHDQHQLLHQDLANQKQNKDSISVNLNSYAESDDDNDRTYRKCNRCNRVRHEVSLTKAMFALGFIYCRGSAYWLPHMQSCEAISMQHILYPGGRCVQQPKLHAILASQFCHCKVMDSKQVFLALTDVPTCFSVSVWSHASVLECQSWHSGSLSCQHLMPCVCACLNITPDSLCVSWQIRMYLCQKRHETWYCGQECFKRDAECHRNTCKQIQLKKKITAKKAQASP